MRYFLSPSSTQPVSFIHHKNSWQDFDTYYTVTTVPGGFPLDKLVMRGSVANHEDGHGGQADIHHQVLVVARLRPNLSKYAKPLKVVFALQ
jgi:hypothetical protein